MSRKVIVVTILFIGILMAAWAFLIEPASLNVREERIAISSWPAACNGRRVAVLADLHVGSPHKGLDSLQDLVKRTNKAKPDLILLPGDFVIQGVVGGTFVTPEDAAKVLAELRAPMGVFAVLGNHDWWLDAKRVEQALAQNNITVLEDKSLKISDADCHLRLVGISDFWEGPHDVEQAMSEVEVTENVLAFTHNPDIFPELPEGIDLTIAGHTHGGQVYFPIVGRPIIPSKYGQRFAIGHILEEGRHLYVSSWRGNEYFTSAFFSAAGGDGFGGLGKVIHQTKGIIYVV